MKIKCNYPGKVRVCLVKDNSLAFEFKVVPGDVVDVVIPADCFVEFVTFHLFV